MPETVILSRGEIWVSGEVRRFLDLEPNEETARFSMSLEEAQKVFDGFAAKQEEVVTACCA
jgi:hypothetical protein